MLLNIFKKKSTVDSFMSRKKRASSIFEKVLLRLEKLNADIFQNINEKNMEIAELSAEITLMNKIKEETEAQISKIQKLT